MTALAVRTRSTFTTSDETERSALGAPLTPELVFEIAAGIADPTNTDASAHAIASVFSPTAPDVDTAWTPAESLKTPRAVAGRLLADEALTDWRDVIPTVDVPTLVTAGELSIYPVAGPTWVAAHIAGASLRVFTAAELGTHFVFWEIPTLFNSVVVNFLMSSVPRHRQGYAHE
jgi:non-heme chloroperoxidase